MASRDDTSPPLDRLFCLLEHDLRAHSDQIRFSSRSRRDLDSHEKKQIAESAKLLHQRWNDFTKEAYKEIHSLESAEESRSLLGDFLPKCQSRMGAHSEPLSSLRMFPGGGLLGLLRPSFAIPMMLEDRTIMIPLDPKNPLEYLLFSLRKELSSLEKELSALEAEIQFPHHEWDSLSLHEKVLVLSHEISCYGFVLPKPESERDLQLLTKRMELLCYEALSYELSAQSNRDRFLLSLIVPRFEYLLKQRCTMIREKHLKLSEIKNKLTQFQPNDDMMLWKVTCFPLVECEPGDFRGISRELGPLLESALQYPVYMNEVVSELDVLSYLSTSGGELIRRSGKRVALNKDTFEQKYVFVCCFNVPFFYPASRSDLYSLINLCEELYSTGRDDFEMVVVARMNPLANAMEVFNHFLSGFPESCLAVPFEDCQKRDCVCNLLGLGTGPDGYKLHFLNPSTKERVFTNFWPYGAEAFPFTEDILDKKHKECGDIVFNRVGLDKVLWCNDDSPDSLNKLSPSGDILETVLISKFSHEVRKKHVGIYLCCDGTLLPTLREVHDGCRKEELEFEVVVVNMPLETGTDPIIHEREICSWLKDHNANDWWCLPFNYSVSMRFWRIIDSCEMNHSDMIIVLGPDIVEVDLYAVNVMVRQGIDAFPFTRDAGIKGAKEKLGKITLESLFAEEDDVSFFRGKNRKETINLSQLVDGRKKILVCIDQLYPEPHEDGFDWDQEFGRLASVYNNEGRDFEMVFVEVESGDRVTAEDREEHMSRMPWYICPREKTNSSIVNKLSKWFWPEGSRQDALIGFGEDGRLCSYIYKECVRRDLFTPLDRNMERLLGYNELTDLCAIEYSRPRPRPRAV